MVGLQVEFYWYQIGAASFLHAFFSTVCFRLEQGNWGSKFPRLMNDLYHGRLKSEYVKDALVELKEIKQELAKFQPSDVIWDIEDLSVKAKLFCPEIAGLFCRIAGLFCHDSRANLSLKPVCFGIAIS